MTTRTQLGVSLKAAFPHTIPVLTGFGFLGFAYGMLMNASGFGLLYTFLLCLTVLGGSLQYVMVAVLLAPFAPLQTFLMALIIQARHLFYGISMLDKYKDLGKKRYYMIFGLIDETFSINYSARIPEEADRGWFMFFVTLLNQLYWIVFSCLGNAAGSILPVNTKGLDFVLTALFVVILLEQILSTKKAYSALIGLISAVICRLVFTSDTFLIPTMICILVFLTALRRPLEKEGDRS